MSNLTTLVSRQPRWLAAIAVAVILLGFLFFRGGGQTVANGVTFSAKRGPLDITVLEGGSIQALESQEIKCEVRVGYQGLKILKIVEEGYQVSEEDIRTNKVLVELDSSELQTQIAQHEIQYQSASASYIEAQQAYDIQLNQNVSDVKAAEQKAKFARMDFDKYMGAQAAEEIVAQIGVDTNLFAPLPLQTNLLDLAALGLTPTGQPSDPKLATNHTGAKPEGAQARLEATMLQLASAAAAQVQAPPPGSAQTVVVSAGPPPVAVGATGSPAALLIPPQPAPSAATAQPSTASEAPTPPPVPEAEPKLAIDFSKYADEAILGDGEAKQKLRDLADALQMAEKERGQNQSTFEGTQRLYEREFMTKIELERDEIAYENSKLKVQKAATARDLFLKYEFPKAAEEFLSKYTEALRELDRARKAAFSKLAQAEARLRSAQGQYQVQLKRRNELHEQLEKCTIRATKPGLVVYGSGDETRFWRGEEQIREGATVRERQTIITIPDMTKMSVQVKIHESYIKKIKKGQKARITVDAFPDEVLEGVVTNVAVLPDSEDRWMNPDMKVYRTTITVHGTYDWIKPGMSAKVEIFVDQLPEVVYVPMQAVFPREGKQVCFVRNGSQPEVREVQVGQFNDEFIEVKSGLQEGEKVFLRAPPGFEPETGPGDELPEGEPEKAPLPPVQQPALPVVGKV